MTFIFIFIFCHSIMLMKCEGNLLKIMLLKTTLANATLLICKKIKFLYDMQAVELPTVLWSTSIVLSLPPRFMC